MSEAHQRDAEIRWCVTFVDSVSGKPIELEVSASDADGAREQGWATLRAARPPGLVVVELVNVRPAHP